MADLSGMLSQIFGRGPNSAAPYPGLLNTGDSGPDYSALNDSGVGISPALAKALAPDPYKELDKKKAAEAAALAARGPFETGVAPDPFSGIANSSALAPGALPFGMRTPPTSPSTYGSMSPVVPGQPASAPDAGPAPIPAASVPLPRPRPDSAPQEPDEAALPDAAAPAEGKVEGQSAVPETSMLGRLGKGISDNSNMLLGLASGLAGAPSFGTGMSRGFAAAIPGSQLDMKQQQIALTQNTAKATYEALKAAGANPQQALVAAFNPESSLAKKLIDTYIGDRKGELKNIKLPNGTEISVIHNPYDHTVTDLNGKPLDINNVQGSLIDPSLTGQAASDAAAQADPALHKRAMALVEGRETWPTGRAMNDPKAKAATDLARQIDPDLTEQRAMERNQFAKDAGNTSPGKVGGQVKAFSQGVDHMLTLAKNAEKYAPSGGIGITPLAHGINAARELGTGQADLANQINAAAQSTAGEVGKLFSGSSGGGVHEREATRSRFQSSNSGPETAGSLESTLELMEGGLRSLEQNRDRVMGDKAGQQPGLQFRTPDTDAKIAEIKTIISRLRGEQGATPAAPKAGKTANGISWSVQ